MGTGKSLTWDFFCRVRMQGSLVALTVFRELGRDLINAGKGVKVRVGGTNKYERTC